MPTLKELEHEHTRKQLFYEFITAVGEWCCQKHCTEDRADPLACNVDCPLASAANDLRNSVEEGGDKE